MSAAPVICAPCDQGRHSNIGPPEYGHSPVCPDKRCQCECRVTGVAPPPKKRARRAKESR